MSFNGEFPAPERRAEHRVFMQHCTDLTEEEK
jgi:hypothetical protein